MRSVSVLVIVAASSMPSTPVGAAVPAARSTGPACTFDGGFEDGFADVTTDNRHEAAVDCIVYWQVTSGLRPGVYAPAGTVTRGQMASFLARFIERSGGTLPSNPPNAFPDDDGTTHAANIDKLAAVGIAGGRADGTYAPDGDVTRNQMASFIVRTLEYRTDSRIEDGAGADYFTDDDGDTHEPNIDRTAALGIAAGTSDTTYGPRLPVRRDQMASFLARSLAELVDRGDAEVPPPPPKCALDGAIERTDSRCRPCPTNPSIAASSPSCRLWSGAPPLGDPALRQTPNAPQVWDNSDPSVLVDGQAVYLFGSTNNVRVPVRQIPSFGQTLADSKRAWDSQPRNAMPNLPAWVDPGPGESDIWAPTVAKIGSQYVMWFGAHHRDATTDESNDQCIGRAVASSPTGPYAPDAQPVYCGLPPEGAGNGLPASNGFGRGALDPQVFRAPDGALYLLVAITRTEANIGVLRLGADGTVQGGRNATPTILASLAYPWHDGTDDGTRQGGFLENPSMVFEPQTGTYLLFYSAGAWWTPNYNTGFARCATPTGPCTPDPRGPFLKSGTTRTGPGGLTAFAGPDGALRAVYATWLAGRENQSGGNAGEYSRQSHWARIVVSATNDPAGQRVALG